MYAYLIETYLLSIVAAVLYGLFIRPFAAPQYRKYALLLIVGLSFLLPLWIDNWAKTQGNPVCLHQHPVAEIVCVDYCPNPEELPVCYEIAMLQERFCECSAVSKENLLVFRQNAFYDACLAVSPWCNIVLLPLAIAALGWWLLQFAYLLYLVLRSRRETIFIKGKTYTILYPPIPIAVGSFKLWHNYIIWQRELDNLSTAEREAILWHEIAHLQQGDTWIKLAIGIMQPLWAINPAYYFFSRELYYLGEVIADKFAANKVNNMHLYISVLLKMKLSRQTLAVHHFAAGSLKQRVLVLTQQSKHYNHITCIIVIILISSLYTTAKLVQPRIAQQFDKVRVYQVLLQDKQSSGRSLFCKHCLLEQLNKQP